VKKIVKENVKGRAGVLIWGNLTLITKKIWGKSQKKSRSIICPHFYIWISYSSTMNSCDVIAAVNEMCNTHRRNEKFSKILVAKLEPRTLKRPRRWRKVNEGKIKLSFRKPWRCRGSGRTAPHVVDFGSKLRRKVSFSTGP
jgi:hypothetical protein